jgi:hypothetical protein
MKFAHLAELRHYNAYEKHDKELLLRLLGEFEDNIII